METPSLKTFLKPRYWYAWPVLMLMLVMSRMPQPLLWHLGTAAGALFSRFPSSLRRFAQRNIELCFPEKKPGERDRLLRDYFRFSGFAVLCMSVAWFSPKKRLRRVVAVSGIQHLRDATASGKSVIAFAPHFIGLDLGAARMSLEIGDRTVSMYRKARDPLLEFLFKRRSRFGTIVLERSAGLKGLLRLIREGRIFYYLPDQDMGGRSSVFAPFFGIPASTVTMLSRIAATTNAVVIPCTTRLLPSGGAEFRFYPPLADFPSGDPAADAARMNREIELLVRDMPEQYMWAYRRFKTRPNQEPSLYA